MNYFEVAQKVNANKLLDFADKAILNQVLSYTLNNQDFYATNDYLKEHWGCSMSAVKRAIQTLKLYRLIDVQVNKKKHTTNGQSWYNKRYIKVNLSTLEDFLNGKIEIEKTVESKAEPTQTVDEFLEQYKANDLLNTSEFIACLNLDEQYSIELKKLIPAAKTTKSNAIAQLESLLV